MHISGTYDLPFGKGRAFASHSKALNLAIGGQNGGDPSGTTFPARYEVDYARPRPERETMLVVWELDGAPVGFSTSDRIAYGEQAFMHGLFEQWLEANRNKATVNIRIIGDMIAALLANNSPTEGVGHKPIDRV